MSGLANKLERTCCTRSAALRSLAIALLLIAPTSAFACRLALVLAVDVSVSVDNREYALQRDGLASALRSPDVIEAFLSSSSPVALSAFEWSGPRYARTILDWSLITSEADMHRAADRVGTFFRFQSGSTSIGNALIYGAGLLAKAPPCRRWTIDVSADGRNNDGPTPTDAFGNPVFNGTTVNALAVGGSEPLGALVEYLERDVVRGVGSFVEIARNHSDFERAMRRKLIREVKTFAMSGLQAE